MRNLLWPKSGSLEKNLRNYKIYILFSSQYNHQKWSENPMISFFFLVLPGWGSPKCVIELHVEGMTWAARCPLRVTQALENVPYVDSANTVYKKKRSTVHATGEGCSFEGEERLIKAIEGLGYKAKVESNKNK